MSQATDSPTTIPSSIHFSSIDARRPRRPAPKATGLQTAFATLKAHVRAFEQPHEPRYEADPDDIHEWAEHLDQVLEATRQYARAVVDHLAQVSPVQIDEETRGLADAASDLVGGLRKAANRLTEAAAEAA
jgi:hypothetical protein